MIVRRGKGDLNKIYRPCTLNEVLGHETIKNTIGRALEKGTLPHSLLFTGPSGCGKTTFARIVALGLNCLEGMSGEPCCECASCKAILNLNSLAVTEIDAGRVGNVDTTRSILDSLPSASMGGENYKVAIFDEAHLLGHPSKSEEALLKFLEDTPDHVYVILCTNEAQKLKVVTRNRCKTIQFGRLLNADIYKLLEQVCQFEGFDYKEDILKYVVEESEGVPRASLSFLQQIASEGSWTKESASMVVNAGVDIDYLELIDFCRVIIKGSFKNSLQFYKDKVKKIPAETIRINICGYFVGCLKKSKTEDEARKFSEIINLLAVSFYNYPRPEHILINNIFKISQILRSGNVQNNKWSSPPGFTGPKI